MFTTILVPIDFSEAATKTANKAAEIASTYGASLHFIHVIEPIETIPYPIHIELESYRQQASTLAHEKMEALTHQINFRDVSHKETIAFGLPHNEINHYVKTHNVDLIMIAPHGKSGIEKFFIGSVTNRLVQTATCNLLVVK